MTASALAWLVAVVALAIAATWVSIERARASRIARGSKDVPSVESAGIEAGSLTAAGAAEVVDALTAIAAHADRLMASLGETSANAHEAREIRRLATNAARLVNPSAADAAEVDGETAVAVGPDQPGEWPLGWPPPRVLVVDDEPGMRDFIKQVLVRAGLEAVAVARARDAVATLSQPPAISLLIVDVIMPEMDGYELAAEARRITPSIPVVFMSAFEPDSARCLIGDSFLAKPFTADSLTAMVKKVLSR